MYSAAPQTGTPERKMARVQKVERGRSKKGATTKANSNANGNGNGKRKIKKPVEQEEDEPEQVPIVPSSSTDSHHHDDIDNGAQSESSHEERVEATEAAEEEEEEDEDEEEEEAVVEEEKPVAKSSDASKKKRKKKVEEDKNQKNKKKSKKKEKEVEEKESSSLYQIPMHRVNRIIKSEDSNLRITQEAVFLINKASEKFLHLFTTEAYANAFLDRKKFIGYKHLSSVVSKQRRFDFLSDFVPEKLKAEDALKESPSEET